MPRYVCTHVQPPTFISKVLRFVSYIQLFWTTVKKLTTYIIVIAYCYELVSMVYINKMATPINNTNYSCHVKLYSFFSQSWVHNIVIVSGADTRIDKQF